MTGFEPLGVRLNKSVDRVMDREQKAREDDELEFVRSETEPEESNLVKHARHELQLCGMFDDTADYNGDIGRGVLQLVELLAEQGHSGTSAIMVIELFSRLARFETLSNLTDDPEEWVEVSENLWQSRRRSEAFSGDNGRTYRLNSSQDILRDTAHRNG